MKPLKVLLIYHCIAGFMAFAAALLVSSRGRHFVLGQLNSSRIVVILVLFFLLISLFGAWWLWNSKRNAEALLLVLDRWLIDDKRLAPSLIVIATFLLTGIIGIAEILLTGNEPGTVPAWAPTTFSWLYVLVVRTLPLTAWALGSLLGLGVFLIWRFRAYIRSSEFWQWRQLGGLFVGLVCIIAALFHWLTLIFQLRFFANHPAWYWTIQFKPFAWHDTWYIAIAGLAGVWLSRNVFRKEKIGVVLVAIFMLGLFLQIGLEYRPGSGLVALRDKYFSTYHSAYPLNASQGRLTILDSIRGYEELYGSRAFTSTKPPGLIAGYMALDRIVNGWERYPDEVRYTRLAWAITYGFPVISMSLVFLLYAFFSRILAPSPGSVPVLAALFFILCPSIILFPLFPDQAIYPILFLALVWLTVRIVEKKSFLWALLLGLIFYAAVFFAFTMLPLYPFAFFFLAVSFLKDRGAWSVGELLKVLLGIAVGSLILYLVFLLVLDYDFLPRFQKAVEINHNFDFYLRVGKKIPVEPASLPARAGQILGAAWINNLDFAAAIGFPIYILFMVHGIRIILQALKKNISGTKDVLQLALFLSFLLLNVAGTAQGEVARLWMFWIPMVVLFAALEIEIFARRRPILLLALVLLQIGTIFLTYHFQDFHM